MKAEDWLPLDALRRLAVPELEGCLGSWAQHWCAQPPLLRAELVDPGGVGELVEMEEDHGGLSMLLSAHASARILALALCLPPAELLMAGADQRVFSRLRASLLEDLAGRLRERLQFDAGGVTGRMLRLVVRDEQASPMFSIALPRGPVSRLARSVLRPGKRRGEPPRMMSEVLADSEVRLEAILGSAEIPLADLGRLAPGDVLVLDRRVDQPVDVRLKDTERPVCVARLEHDPAGLAIELC